MYRFLVSRPLGTTGAELLIGSGSRTMLIIFLPVDTSGFFLLRGFFVSICRK